MFERVLSGSLVALLVAGTAFILNSTPAEAGAPQISPVDLQRRFSQLIWEISFQEGINPNYGRFGELLRELLHIPYDEELAVQFEEELRATGEITIRTGTYYLGEVKRITVDYYYSPGGERIVRLYSCDTSDPEVLKEISIGFNYLADPLNFPESIRLQDFEGGRGLIKAEIFRSFQDTGEERLYFFERRNGLPVLQPAFAGRNEIMLFSHAVSTLLGVIGDAEKLGSAAVARHGLAFSPDPGEFGEDLQQLLAPLRDEDALGAAIGDIRIGLSEDGLVTFYHLGPSEVPRLLAVFDDEGRIDWISSARMAASDRKEAIIFDFSPEDRPGYTEVRYLLFDYTGQEVLVSRKLYQHYILSCLAEDTLRFAMR